MDVLAFYYEYLDSFRPVSHFAFDFTSFFKTKLLGSCGFREAPNLTVYSLLL